MNTAIANPTKSLSLNFPVDVVRDVVKNLVNHLSEKDYNGYTKETDDDIISRYKFAKSEFLSLGSYINIMIDGDENKTTVNIEMSRKMGAYDNWVEVSNANRQMTEVLEAISYGLNPNKEEVKSERVHNGGNTDMEITNTFWAIAIFVVLFFFFLK
jgi:hypothetical protein